MLPEYWESIAKKQALLKDYTTFKIGGPVTRLIEISKRADLIQFCRDMHQAKTSWKLMGQGSNILVSDNGLDGIVIIFRSDKKSIWINDNNLIASGGVLLHDAVLASVKSGLSGLAFAAGIPGTIGGAIHGNAGAFGKQIGDIIESVTILEPDGSLAIKSGDELGFSYRNSIIKNSGRIILQASLSLEPGDRAKLEQEVQEILALREQKHPNLKNLPSAGSFFKNIEPTSNAERRQAAGAFLDQAGAKDFSVGGASVFEKHANIIVNNSQATASEVISLAIRMRCAVHDKFGIDLKREVIIWPESNADDLPDK